MAWIMIEGSNAVLFFGPFIILGILIGLGIVMQWSKTEKGGISLDRSLLNIPLFGNIFFLSELFQLSSLLGTLIWSGIGLTENLKLCERTIRNRFFDLHFGLLGFL